jgi:hypothetical protein
LSHATRTNRGIFGRKALRTVELRKGLAIVRFGIGRPQVEVIVSVSGAGTTTTTRRLSWNFIEADGLHANQNVAMI